MPPPNVFRILLTLCLLLHWFLPSLSDSLEQNHYDIGSCYSNPLESNIMECKLNKAAGLIYYGESRLQGADERVVRWLA